MTSVHDFQRRPVLSLVEWKYYLQLKKDFFSGTKNLTPMLFYLLT